VTLVHGVDVTLQRGRVLGLIGESGAGKSTIGLSAMAYGRGGVRLTGGHDPPERARDPLAGPANCASCAGARSPMSRNPPPPASTRPSG
jgi:ABC-type uncharacterized transport system ATPase subunit